MVFWGKASLVVFFIFMLTYTPVESEPHFSYFKLLFLWPNSYCSNGFRWCKKPVPQEFKLGGLWPFIRNKHVKPCEGSAFPINEYRSWNFSDDLYSFWPNLNMWRQDIMFWKLQWDKHGSCSGLSAQDYFYLAVHYAKSYRNIYNSLLESNMTISSYQPYQRRILYDQIEKAVGSSPTLKCCKTIKPGQIQLSEVHICIHTQDGMTFNCPRMYSECGGRNTLILFP